MDTVQRTSPFPVNHANHTNRADHANAERGLPFRPDSLTQGPLARVIVAHTRVPPPSGPGRQPPPGPLPEIDPDRMPPPGDDDNVEIPRDPERLPEVDPPSREPPVGLI